MRPSLRCLIHFRSPVIQYTARLQLCDSLTRTLTQTLILLATDSNTPHSSPHSLAHPLSQPGVTQAVLQAQPGIKPIKNGPLIKYVLLRVAMNSSQIGSDTFNKFCQICTKVCPPMQAGCVWQSEQGVYGSASRVCMAVRGGLRIGL